MLHWDAGKMKGNEQFQNIKGLLKKMEVLWKDASRLQKVWEIKYLPSKTEENVGLRKVQLKHIKSMESRKTAMKAKEVVGRIRFMRLEVTAIDRIMIQILSILFQI